MLGLDNREIWHAQPILQPREVSVVKHMRHPSVGTNRFNHPVIRMISISTHRRGYLDKRMQIRPAPPSHRMIGPGAEYTVSQHFVGGCRVSGCHAEWRGTTIPSSGPESPI